MHRYAADGMVQTELGLPLVGIGVAEIGKHVAAAARDRFRTAAQFHALPNYHSGCIPVREFSVKV